MGTKRSICFLIIILTTLCSLFAEEIVLSWNHPDKNISLFRWRKGEEEWTVTKDKEIFSTFNAGSTDEYHIQASYDGENWSSDRAVVLSSSKEIETLWSWTNKDDQVSYYRWRIDGGDWNIIDSSEKSVRTTLTTDGTHTFEICSSYDGENWSEPNSSLLTTVSIVVPKPTRTSLIRFEAAASFSLSYGLYDFYNGHHIAGARYLMKTDPSFSLDGELLLSIGKWFRLFAGYSYSRESKRETVIPDAFLVEYHQAAAGYDFLFPFKNKWRAYVGLGAASSMDINAGYWSPSFFLCGRIGLDYFLSEHFYVGIKSGVRISHYDAKDPLYRSYTYLTDPVGIKMGVKF